MRTQIEKERKWLLKRMPSWVYDNYSQQLYIEQFYDKDGWRYRLQTQVGSGKHVYCRLKKKSLGRGINAEVGIEDLTEQQYNDAMMAQQPTLHVVRKDRYVVDYKGKVLEFDYFHDCTLIVLEIEDVEFDETIIMPEKVENEILMEVTGNPKFSNYNLAIEEVNE